MVDAGDVDQPVNLTLLDQHRPAQPLDLFPRGGIARMDAQRPRLLRARRRLAQSVLPEVDRSHATAAFGEPFRHGTPDPVACAGDDEDPSCQVSSCHVRPSSSGARATRLTVAHVTARRRAKCNHSG